MLAGMIIVAMLVGLLATSIALAASLPLGVALLLYPAAGSVFLMAVIALRMGLAASAADLPAAARPSRAR